jgi:putative iron-regulated protein
MSTTWSVDRTPASCTTLERFPVLAAGVLEVANERGSETNVSVGWHAIEFLLWGQDASDARGPGERPFQ